MKEKYLHYIFDGIKDVTKNISGADIPENKLYEYGKTLGNLLKSWTGNYGKDLILDKKFFMSSINRTELLKVENRFYADDQLIITKLEDVYFYVESDAINPDKLDNEDAEKVELLKNMRNDIRESRNYIDPDDWDKAIPRNFKDELFLELDPTFKPIKICSTSSLFSDNWYIYYKEARMMHFLLKNIDPKVRVFKQGAIIGNYRIGFIALKEGINNGIL